MAFAAPSSESKKPPPVEEGHGGSRRRKLGPGMSRAVAALCVLFGVYTVMYVLNIFGRFEIYIHPISHHATFLLAILVLIFLTQSARPGHSLNRIPWYDWVLIAAATVSVGYAVRYGGTELPLLIQQGTAGVKETVFAFVTVVCLLEASRRVVGSVYPAIVAMFVLYGFFSNYFPGFLHGRGYGADRIAYTLYVGTDGLWGSPLRVASTVIIIFVIFSGFLQNSGAGDFFLRLAFAIIGHYRGGPAKAAVIASCLFGTFTGSPSANVAGTGVITIPMMKRMGYTSEFAGGVEAAASTGGTIMPPVMGVVAFLMAEFLGIPYIMVALSATIPALLYYTSIFTMVHLEAVRLNLSGIPKSERPPLGETVRTGWYFGLPILAIILFMALLRLSPEVSGVYAIVLLFLLSFVRKSTRMGLSHVVRAITQGVRATLSPGAGCALSGVLIAAITLPGTGLKFSSEIIQMSGGNLFVLLVLAGLACLFLSMGLHTLPLYITVVVLVAPALVKMGMLPIAAHFFVFYIAILAFITPPVAQAAFTAAGIADSNPMKTAVWASRLGLIAAVVPFAFAYNPALLFIGSPLDIIVSFVTAVIGTMSIASGSQGYLRDRCSWLERGALLAGGTALLFHWWYFNVGGLVLVALALVTHLSRVRVRAAVTTRTGD